MPKADIDLNKLLQALFYELWTAFRRIFDTSINVIYNKLEIII